MGWPPGPVLRSEESGGGDTDTGGAGLVRSCVKRVRDDLAADPYLAWILVLSALLAGFWFWHRVPNFATRDERWRLLDAVEVAGHLLREPGFGSFREGVLHGRSYGATLYIYAPAALVAVAVALLTGRGGVVAALGTHSGTDALWGMWQRTPGWFWTLSLLAGRLITVTFAVGCVYVTYRIGTTIRDRATGRLAALLTTLAWGLLVLAHEVGEDVPALFFLLVLVYFALRYVETGREMAFYLACLSGGIATATKLTAGVGAVILGVAYLQRARRSEEWPRSAVRPGLVIVGGALGANVVALGYPSAMVAGPGQLLGRIARGLSSKGTLHYWRAAPSWWWVLRGYLSGLGLPLSVAVLGGVAASLPRLRERSLETDAVVLALAGTLATLAVVVRWEYVRTHHLLMTFPLLVVVLAVALGRFSEARPSLGRAVIALVVLTGAVYAGAGTLGYAAQPRDRATAWLSDHAGPDETVETYALDPQETGIPHGANVSHPGDRRVTVAGETVEVDYATWVRAMPRRCPAYVELTYARGLQYDAPDGYSRRAALLSDPAVERYVRDLLAGEYPYEVAARFGRPPPFHTNATRDRWRALLRAGIRPRSAQYGDPQDLGVTQYTVVLERVGPCRPATNGSA